MIQLVNVSKKYKQGIKGISERQVQAVNSLSLRIPSGEVFGFLGPNGAGKSTTIKILMNLVYPDSGQAMLLGRSVQDAKVRAQVGYLPENPHFYEFLTPDELLWFCGTVSGIDRKDIRGRSDEMLERLSLRESRKRQLRTFSKGMLQRMGIAAALLHDPSVVIFDEPMSGLDPLGRKMVGDIILDLKARGKTVFFSSHILNDVEKFCDRVGIMVDSRLRVVDRIDALLSVNSSLEEAFLREVQSAGGGVEV